MKTIEAIRLENYRRLVAELGDEVKPPAIATALGISKVYAWQSGVLFYGPEDLKTMK